MSKPTTSIPSCTPQQAFEYIRAAQREGRRVIPLLGSGVSFDAGIPTARFLCDYIVTVGELAKLTQGLSFRRFIQVYGWPRRHDTWARWISSQGAVDISTLEQKLKSRREALFQESVRDELSKASPLYARLATQALKAFSVEAASLTDYRSLLATVTESDPPLIDAFFDHLVRGRNPSTTHQFIAFFVQLLNVDLLLTTNFDPLLEVALRTEGFNPTVYEVDRRGSVPSSRLVRAQPLSIVKLHGGTHGLRTGYDLDERLPVETLEEIRGYFRHPERNEEHPLLLVVGYSGSDRRVMDIVTDHLMGARSNEKALRVLWISREGHAPELLERFAKHSQSSKETTNVDGRNEPVCLCNYRSGQLFFQEAYQVLRHEFAVSRSSYRAIGSLSRATVTNKPKEIKEKHNPKSSRFTLFWARTQGLGTSYCLSQAAFKEFGPTHEVIWLDASDFNSRATFVSHIHDEFARLDRGHATFTRPLLLRDVDYFECALSQADKVKADEAQVDRTPADPADPAETDRAKLLKRSTFIEEEAWEAEVSIRWLIQALRRNNYAICLDSLGEFGAPHPAIPDRLSADLDKLRREQFDRLASFLGALANRSESLGTSAVLGALTPMAWSEDETNYPQGKHVFDILQTMTAARGHEFGELLEQPDKGSAQTSSTIVDVDKFREFAEKSGNAAVAIILMIASAFRRPRSRTALIVTAIRFLKKILQRSTEHGDVPPKLSELALRAAEEGYSKQITDSTMRLESEEAFTVLSKALDSTEQLFIDVCEQRVPLLSRLEGGFYWMHFDVRRDLFNEIYNKEDSGKLYVPKPLRAELYDDIALFAKDDVYDRSHDAVSFCEYIWYRILSILFLFDSKNPDWENRLLRLVKAISCETDMLLAQGKLPSVLQELSFVIQVIRHLADKCKTEDDAYKHLATCLEHLLGSYAKLQVESGHSKYALRYRLLQAQIMAEDPRHMNELFDNIQKLTVDDFATFAEGVTPQLLDKQNLRAPLKKRLELLIELARALSEPIFLFEDFVREFDSNQEMTGKWIHESTRRKARRATVINLLNAVENKCNQNRNGEEDCLESLALARARRMQLELNRIICWRRFGWLCNAIHKGDDPTGSLSELIKECENALQDFRAAGHTVHGARVKNFLRSMRAVMYCYNGDRGYPQEPKSIATVDFERARAILQRPKGPSENTAEAVTLLMEAECQLNYCRYDKLAKLEAHANFYPKYRDQKPKLTDKIEGDEDDIDSRKQLLRLEQEHTEARKFDRNAKKDARRLMKKVTNLLNQAKSLLERGRADNRWRTFRCFVASSCALLEAELCKFLTEPENISGRSCVYLEAALQECVTGLSIVGKDSDERIALKALFQRIEKEAIGQKHFSPQEWAVVRVRAGLRGAPWEPGRLD